MVGSTANLPITRRSRSAYIFHPNRDPKPGLVLLLGFAPTERTLPAVPSSWIATVADPGDPATFSVFWLTSSPFHSPSGSVSVLGPEMPCLWPFFFSCLIVLKISVFFPLYCCCFGYSLSKMMLEMFYIYSRSYYDLFMPMLLMQFVWIQKFEFFGRSPFYLLCRYLTPLDAVVLKTVFVWF